jgi:inorganic triphosphatase YgiF
MSSHQEIEAKYQVGDPALFAELLGLDHAGRFALHPAATPIDQLNTYFDTHEWRLRQARYGFRVRIAQGYAKATLKGPTLLVNDVHTRSEWEVELPDDDLANLPVGALRNELLRLTGGAPLRPTLSIRNRRQIIEVLDGQRPVVEIALDNSVINAGGQTQHFYELELELIGAGLPVDLQDLAATLCDRYMLAPEPRSKLERGLALLESAV